MAYEISPLPKDTRVFGRSSFHGKNSIFTTGLVPNTFVRPVCSQDRTHDFETLEQQLKLVGARLDQLAYHGIGHVLKQWHLAKKDPVPRGLTGSDIHLEQGRSLNGHTSDDSILLAEVSRVVTPRWVGARRRRRFTEVHSKLMQEIIDEARECPGSSIMADTGLAQFEYGIEASEPNTQPRWWVVDVDPITWNPYKLKIKRRT